MAHTIENMKDNEDCVIITDQGTIDLSDSQKNIKSNCESNNKKDDQERNSALDKVPKDNVRQGNMDAWRNLKYMTNKQTIKHNLPLMSPPERLRSVRIGVRGERDDKQKKGLFDINTQTNHINIVNDKEFEVIKFMNEHNISNEMLFGEIYRYYDDDMNNNMENQSDFEQESASQPEMVVPTASKSGEDTEIYNLIQKYSEENKAIISNLINSSFKKMSHPFTDISDVKNKNNLFEFIYHSLWQIVAFMGHHKDMIAKKEDKVKSCVDRSTQTTPDILTPNKGDNSSAQTVNTKEITMFQLSSDVSKNTECDILEQNMQIIHGNYPKPVHPKDPRARCQQNQQNPNQPKKALIKKPRLNSAYAQEKTAVNCSNHAMKTNNDSQRWQFGSPAHFVQGTRAAQQYRQWYYSNMPRPQWYNAVSPPIPPPPTPPPPFNLEPRFTAQPTSSMAQYQISYQMQEVAEYQKYQQMEMQKKAWESQLKNYPNSAWSHPVQEN